MRTSVWVGARVVGGLGIVVGLLALVALSWAERGTDDATRLFELLQGVILGTLGWLYGTQGFEAARQAALREGLARRNAEETGDENEERMAKLELDVERGWRLIERLRAEPALREKIDEETRRMEE
jgi:hypothetical protein